MNPIVLRIIVMLLKQVLELLQSCSEPAPKKGG